MSGKSHQIAVILGWGLLLLLTRRWVSSVDENSTDVDQIQERLTNEDKLKLEAAWARVNNDLSAVQSAIAELQVVAAEFESGAAVQTLADIAKGVEQLMLEVSENSHKTNDPQVVHRGDAFLTATVSGIPSVLSSEQIFCDQLMNSFPRFFGGDVPTSVVEKWCRDEALAVETFEHLPPGVDDVHYVPFTLLQVFRKLYWMGQFQDRLIRYREGFSVLIDAIEKRPDRMLYNYI